MKNRQSNIKRKLNSKGDSIKKNQKVNIEKRVG